MNCLYSGDKPLGIVQSNAEDVAYDSNTSVKEKIDEKANKGWTYIGEADNVNYTTVNISNYTEVMLLLKSISNDMIFASTITPVSVAQNITINAYIYSNIANKLYWSRLYSNGTKIISGDSDSKAILYGR